MLLGVDYRGWESARGSSLAFIGAPCHQVYSRQFSARYGE